MAWALRFYRSTVGKKVLMALTGVFLFGFVIIHLIGNLQIFIGQKVFDEYAAILKETPALVWGMRVALLISVVAHIVVSVQLAALNKSARPVGYRQHEFAAARYAARTMIWSGPIVGLFVIYHLLHFTIGTVHPTHPDFDPTDVYMNVVRGFQVWPVSAFYILAILGLGLHMSHGIWSMFQSLGLTHPKVDGLVRTGALVVAGIMVAGYISIPVAVLAGTVH